MFDQYGKGLLPVDMTCNLRGEGKIENMASPQR